jgi:RNA polymerase sigma-70 factor (ECF subfamily)
VKAWLKRRQRLPPAFDDAAIDRLMHRSIDAARRGDARRSALEDCLQRLPDAQRQLLARRYSPDVSVAEMAAQQSMNPAALSQALRRIRIALLACIERKLSGAAS